MSYLCPSGEQAVKYIDRNTGIVHLFAIRIGMNKLDHCILASGTSPAQAVKNIFCNLSTSNRSLAIRPRFQASH